MARCSCYDDAEKMKREFAVSGDDDLDSLGGSEEAEERSGCALEAAVAHRGAALEAAYEGFLATAKKAVQKLCDAVFAISGFRGNKPGSLDKLFRRADFRMPERDGGGGFEAGPGWERGECGESLAFTLGEFLEDLQAYLLPDWYGRCAEALMERTLGSYAARFFTQCAPMDKAGLPVAAVHARMGADLQLLRDVFERALAGDARRLARVAAAFQPLADLHELVGAAGGEELVAAWRLLLANAPHTGIGIVDAVLRLRADLPQRLRDAVLAECRAVWEESKGRRRRNVLVKGLVKGLERVEDAADAARARRRCPLRSPFASLPLGAQPPSSAPLHLPLHPLVPSIPSCWRRRLGARTALSGGGARSRGAGLPCLAGVALAAAAKPRRGRRGQGLSWRRPRRR